MEINQRQTNVISSFTCWKFRFTCCCLALWIYTDSLDELSINATNNWNLEI